MFDLKIINLYILVCLSKAFVDLNPNICSLLEQSFPGLRFALQYVAQCHKCIRFNGLKYALNRICSRLFTHPLECCAKTTPKQCLHPKQVIDKKHYRDKKFYFVMSSYVLTRSPVI